MDIYEDAVDLFGQPLTAPIDEDETRRALDELFRLTQLYNSTKAYDGLLTFIRRFRFYAPYNAMLIHMDRSEEEQSFFCIHGYWPESVGDELPHRIKFTAQGIKTTVNSQWDGGNKTK